MTLVVPESVRDELVSRAREGAPEEICGILAGKHGESESRVGTSHPAENVAKTPRTRYEIDPREQLDLLETIEASDREVVGFYHSHPRGPANPSATDAELATWPGKSYVVVSLDGEPSVGSWRWTGDEFVTESIRTVCRR